MGGRLSIVAKHEKRTGDGTGVGLFFPLPGVLAEGFPSLGDNDRSPPHVTFLYVGDVSPEQEDVFLSTCQQVFAEWGRPTRAQHRGLDYFENPAKPGRVAINRVRFDDDMADLRSKLSSRLQDVGIEIQDSFPVYQPHTTLAYLDGLDATYDGPVPGGQWEATEAEVWGLPKVHAIPLGERGVEKRASSNLVYRIQPKGKPLQGWRSKDMDGNPINGTFVFESMKDLTETVSLWRPEELEDTEILEIRYDGPRDEHPLESGTLIDADQATIVRRLPLKQGLRRAAEKIPGGLAKGKKPSDFDQKALAKGIKVEMEHTEDESVAREIAMDHLTEDPAYYDKLEKIEKKAMEFPTEDAMETYLKEHPGADKSLHHVKKHEEPEQVPAKKSWHTKLKDSWKGLREALGQEWKETKVLGKTVTRLLKGDAVSEQEIAAAKEQAVDVLKLITTQGFPFPGASVYIEFIIRALNKVLGKNWTSLPSAFRPKLASSAEWLHFAKTFTLNEGDPILFGKWKNKPGVISGFKMDPVSGDPIVVITPAKGRGDKEVKLLKIRYDKARAQEMPDPAMRVASRYVQRRHLQAAIGDVEKYLPEFKKTADSYRAVVEMASGMTPEEWQVFSELGPAERAQFRTVLTSITRIWVYLITTGQPYVRAILEAKEIPKGKTKALELAARAFLAVKRNPKKVLDWWPKNVRHVELLLAAATWPDKQEGGDQLFTVGPFKVHNSTSLRGDDLEATKKTLVDAIKRIHGAKTPKGLSKVLYGDVYLAAKLRQAEVMAWYYRIEDHLYLRPAKSKTLALSHQLIHELTHRFWQKFASDSDKKAWERHHLDMSMPTRDQVKMPVPGDILPFQVKGWDSPPKVRSISSRGYELTPTGVTNAGFGGEYIYITTQKLIPYLAKAQNFPTSYATTSAEEHFCEATATYLLGTLPEKQAGVFESVWGKGKPA